MTGPTEDPADRPALLLDDHFAPVPEWLLDAPISDAAVRLYAVLLRYGQTSGARMPSRATLARRIRKTSVDSVDRALKELVAIDAVTVERRRVGGVNQTNRYHLRTRRPGEGRSAAATPELAHDLGAGCVPDRPAAAHVVQRDGRMRAAPSRTDAAPVAAQVRPDPEQLTQRETNPQPLSDRLHDLEWERLNDLAGQLGHVSAEALESAISGCVARREALGLATERWTVRSVVAALQLSIQRGWPTERMTAVLLEVAADAATRSPMRLAEAGPWWKQPPAPPLRRTAQEETELRELEAKLADRDDRAFLQARARQELLNSSQPVDRLNVARCAWRLADSSEAKRPQSWAV